MKKKVIQSDVIRGNINTIILKALYGGERYGYDIIKEINEATSGQYDLKQPTLYSCLTRLESQGFIQSYWGSKSNGGRRKYYSLTDLGREVFLQSQSDWEFSRTVMDRLISNKTVDLDAMASEQGITTKPDETEQEIDFKQNEENISAQNIILQDNQNEIIDITTQNLQEDTETTESVAKKIESNFANSGNMMTELFQQELIKPSTFSYTEKLISEKCIVDRTIKTNKDTTYFKDFYNVDDEVPYTDKSNKLLTDNTQANEANNLPKNNLIQDKSVYSTTSGVSQVNVDNIKNEQIQTQQEKEKRIAEKEHFINYNENITKLESAATNIFDREYRNILGSFANQCFIANKQTIISPIKPAETIDSPKNSDVILQNNSSINEPATKISADTTATMYTKDSNINKKFNKMADDMRELGNNIKIRTADSDTSKAYSKMSHFYSNKLMLKHYAILFGIMLVEILITSLLTFVGLKINRKGDVYYYIAAVVLALLFPTIAFIKNYTDPNKTKRINFNLKSSLIYRTIVMCQCLLIIYCYNLFFNMPLTFSVEYITTLLLPAILCTNFPISALIFNGLFKTKQYAVD